MKKRMVKTLKLSAVIMTLAGLIGLGIWELNPIVDAQAVREFQLVAQEVKWNFNSTLVPFEAWAFNGQVPGPMIRVKEGELVRVTFRNDLPESTTVHWHGIDVPNDMDGVPGITQRPIEPGETYVYQFAARPAGTRFYHTHGNGEDFSEADQIDRGLYGPIIIDPVGASTLPEYVQEYFANRKFDREYTVMLDEWRGGEHGAHGVGDYGIFTFNGKAFPDIEPIVVKRGERVRIRLINAGTTAFHPIHLHGHQFKVVATDGNPVPEVAQLVKNTITVMPGESYDIEFVADNPGTWAFHCHELHHVAGGMATVVQYEESE